MTPIFSIFERAQSRHRDALAHDIAARSVALVLRRLHADTAAMGVAELRGYVRARAFGVVIMEARKLIAADQVHSQRVDELTTAALERTVHVVVRDLLVPPVIAMPAPHVPLRIAA